MKKYVIIAGAGISVDPPSNLPSWWEYNKKLIKQIKKEALKLCPDASEILTRIDVEKELPVQCISQLVVSQGAGQSYFPLLELLDGANPNANHFALAELARQGKLKTVVTTNFDTLIETAFRKEAVPLYTVVHKQEFYESTGTATCKLIKIHGSVHDHKTLIDTVSQKAIGLSDEKLYLLEETFADSEIIVIGFSGSDLDFDINYIPFMQALENGNTLTWIVHPNSKPNPNVIILQKKYPDQVYVKVADLPEFFTSVGVDYEKIKNNTKKDKSLNYAGILDQRIEELFSSAYIGTHGCIGYCLTMLEMIGEYQGATLLAQLYEKKLDWSELNIFSVLGINALAHQKLLEEDFEGSVRCYNAVIQCHQRLNDLNHKFQHNNQMVISPDLKRAQKLEYAQNMATAYLNLGVVYYYMCVLKKEDTLKEAEEMLENAHLLIQDEPTILMHSMVTFNRGRVKFQLNGDYDQYLNVLRISKEYAKNEGRLDTLAEILHEECDVRMMIGEYYLAEQALSISRSVLKNVGRTVLKQQNERLFQQYQERTGDINQKFAEAYIQKLQKKVDNPVRQMIISLEAQKQKNIIPELFVELCRDYLKKEDWLRLEDLSLCYLDAVSTDIQRSDAWYLLGYAMMEQANYVAAEKYFSQIIDLGDRADQIKLGWSHSEFARLRSKKGDVQHAVYHFEECLRVLEVDGRKKELASAGVNCIRALFENKFLDDAEKCATQLLVVIDKKDVDNVKKQLNYLRMMNKPAVCSDVQDKSPQVLATEANELHRCGSRKQAWELMALAKEKYRERDDKEGVGRCENNMGCWCITEDNQGRAIEHFKAAIEIKHSLEDTSGVAKQLAILLQLFINQSDLEKSKIIVNYAEQNMPTFVHTQEKYALYYSIFEYFFTIEEYAPALAYLEKAEEGLNYLTGVQVDIERLSKVRTLLKDMFKQQPIQNMQSQYEKKIQEAIRLYKSGRLEESLSAIEQLRNEYGYDLMKKGEIEGTCANAYLHNKRYHDAIDSFENANRIFETVGEEQWDLVQDKQATVVNGMALALWNLGKNEESLDLFRKELKQKNFSGDSQIMLTINFCNRVVLYNQDSIIKENAVFNEVQDMLDSINHQHYLDHEVQGKIYCSYGMLYMAADDKNTAKVYYKQAKDEFLITNSQHIEEVERVLKILEDE